MLKLQDLKQHVSSFISSEKKSVGVQCSFDDKRTRFSLQNKVVDDSDEEFSEPLSDSFESDEEGQMKMQKQNRF